MNKGQKPHKALTLESVLYQAHGSLARLRVETIDVLYLHGPGKALTVHGGSAGLAPRRDALTLSGMVCSRLGWWRRHRHRH